MGLFSKLNSKAKQTGVEDTISQIIVKWQGWVESFVEGENDGKKYSLSDLNEAISFLVTESAARNDELLLQWTSKACVAIRSATKDIVPIEEMAQVMFDVAAYTGAVRRNYAENLKIQSAISLMGLSVLKSAEFHPNYNEVLDYLRLNSQKLAGH